MYRHDNDRGTIDLADAIRRARTLRSQTLAELLARARIRLRAWVTRQVAHRHTRAREYWAFTGDDGFRVDKRILDDCRHLL